jgi:flagellar assembly factor FliW
MLIETPRFGKLEVSEERVVTFAEGLLGFRDFKRFFFHQPAPDAVLLWMQSLELPALAFVVADPRMFKPDYTVNVTAMQLDPLLLTDLTKATVWVILTVPEDPTKMTANLQGPLVVNLEKKLGAQVVINEEGMTTKYPVLEGLRKRHTACSA